MVDVSTIAAVDFAFGLVASLGLLYLFYAETMVVHYRRFFRLITLGLLVYAVTGPVIGALAPAYIHAIHATAVVFIAVGLYDLVREDLDRDEDFAAVLTLDAPESPASTDLDADATGSDTEH